MSDIRSALVAAAMLVVATVFGAVIALALTQTTSQTTSSSSNSSKIDELSSRTPEEWNNAKAELAKELAAEKERWADCQNHAQDENMTGRESWLFLSSCPTRSSTN